MSNTFKSKIFGEVSVNEDGGYWSGETQIGERRLERSIVIGHTLADQQPWLDRAAQLVDGLETLDARAQAAIAAQLASEGGESGTVRDSVNFHLEELGADVRKRLFGKESGIDDASFLKALNLVGVAVHGASSKDGFYVVLDYSLGRDITDQLLAVRVDMSGEVVSVSLES